MKKIILTIFGFTVIFASDNTYSDYSKNISLDLRATYINYRWDKGFSNSTAFASTAKLKYEHEILDGLKVGVALATVQDFGLDTKPGSVKTAYIFDGNYETFSIVQQAYISYKYSKSFIQVGRFELETPLISSDDYFILANSFEGITLDIGEVKNTLFRVGYISKMAGAWDSSYDGGHFCSMTKQAWVHRADLGSDNYYNYVDDLGVKNAGLGYIGVVFDNDKLKIQLYDHLLFDAYNSIFTQVDYNIDLASYNLLIAAQYVIYDGVGAIKNNPNPDIVIDYETYSAKAIISNDRYSLNLAYTGVSDDGSIHTFGSFGAYSEFASGLLVSYFNTSLRDSNIFAFEPSISLGDSIDSFSIGMKYSYYDLNSNYTKGGILGDRVRGDGYMYVYGLYGEYIHKSNLSFVAKVSKGQMQHGDRSSFIRTILKYKF